MTLYVTINGEPIDPRINGRCRNGHPRTVKNTYLRSNGERNCKICASINYKARRIRLATPHANQQERKLP